MNLSTEEVKVYLLKHNIKPSYHRVAILKHLLSGKIILQLIKYIMSWSKCPHFLKQQCIIPLICLAVQIFRVITIEENETRYDGDVSDHGHLNAKMSNYLRFSN